MSGIMHCSARVQIILNLLLFEARLHSYANFLTLSTVKNIHYFNYKYSYGCILRKYVYLNVPHKTDFLQTKVK